MVGTSCYPARPRCFDYHRRALAPPPSRLRVEDCDANAAILASLSLVRHLAEN
jgi:hypothetical protein